MSIFKLPAFQENKLKLYTEFLNHEIKNYRDYIRIFSMDRLAEYFIQTFTHRYNSVSFVHTPHFNLTSFMKEHYRFFELEDAPIDKICIEEDNFTLTSMIIAYSAPEMWRSEALYYIVYSLIMPELVKQRLGILDTDKKILNFKNLLTEALIFRLTHRVNTEQESLFIRDCLIDEERFVRSAVLEEIRQTTLDVISKKKLKVREAGTITAPIYYVYVPIPNDSGKNGARLAEELCRELEQMYSVNVIVKRN